MQRKQTPAKQVALVEAFLGTAGLQPKHAEVLELVAKLNGAANWNELERAPRENKVTKALRKMLRPWAQDFGAEAELNGFQPAVLTNVGQSIRIALFQVVLGSRAGADEKTAATAACTELDALSEYAKKLARNLRKQLGHDREVEIPPGFESYEMSTTMFDEEQDWQVSLDDFDIDLPEELREEIFRQAVVSRARVEYPRGDRYGVPTEASEEGCREYLWEQGFAVATTFEGYGVSTGDDSMARCIIKVYLPSELVQRIREAVEPQ